MKISVTGGRLLAVAACFAVLGLAACTASYKQSETSGLAASSVRLDSAKNVFVSVSPDGQYGSRTYAGTGRLVAQQTAAAFSRYARRVEIGGGPAASRDELLAAARKAGAGYLVMPNISHWEPRATEWSGVPSRVSMSLTVIDAETGVEIRSALLESRSAVVTLVRPNPDNLSQQMIDQQVSALYGVNSANQ
jgi:hypothetical protein